MELSLRFFNLDLMRNMSEIIPKSSPLFSHEVLLDQLIECGRLFHSRGWSVGTSSNYSAVLNNDPAELIVTASGKDKGRLGRLDFVHIGANGSPIEPDQPLSLIHI